MLFRVRTLMPNDHSSSLCPSTLGRLMMIGSGTRKSTFDRSVTGKLPYNRLSSEIKIKRYSTSPGRYCERCQPNRFAGVIRILSDSNGGRNSS